MGRQLGQDNGYKLGEVQVRCELTSMTRSLTRMDRDPCEFLLSVPVALRLSCVSQGPGLESETHKPVWELGKLKEDPRKGREVSSAPAASHQ